MLEVLNNRTEHTHENQQFRRVVTIVENTFQKLGYSGLLIGNPFNEMFSRFRADAILFYNNGVILIDFKDYQGIIKLPSNENEFHSSKWYNESIKDRKQLEIKAGATFINPFKQLVSYRNAFREVVEKNKYLGEIDSSRVCIVNVFSGPIEIHNEVPKNLPYYKLIQESDLGDFLYDFASENTYDKDTAEVLKGIFPAEKWEKNIESSVTEPKIIEKQVVEIDDDVEKSITDFLKEEKGGILVLESMNVTDRDSWLGFITTEASNYNIPQIEKWTHSARISKKVLKRCNIRTLGIYSIIYAGSDVEELIEEVDGQKQEELQEVISIKENKEIDDNALIIIHEAHLISRSLNQSEFLRFGSGRLLEDVFEFLNPKSNRKIVFIGDPYSLSFGKVEDRALDLNTLSDLYGKKIKHYRKSIQNDVSEGREKLRTDLAISIEQSLFNNLNYYFDETTLINSKGNEKLQDYLCNWFSEPLSDEPNNAVLFYSKKDCQTTNNWIKKHCLKNGNNLASGDLLIVENNALIPDENGFQIPKRIINGMYLTVLGVKETVQTFQSIRQVKTPVCLSFTKIRVKCLSLSGLPETDVWILDNYLNSKDKLTKEEQIAFRVFVNEKINEKMKELKFEDSREYKQLQQDEQYKKFSDEDKQAVEKLAKNYSLPKEDKEEVKTNSNVRGLLSNYYRKYKKNLFYQIKNSDPLVNAVYVNYGWAITVHKALVSEFDETIIKGCRKENDGITNGDYFRWLYSGVTAGKIVNITSPQYINPFMYCVFEDNSSKGVSIKSKELFIYEDYEPEERFKEKIHLIENKNVIGVICEFSKLLERNGYLLEETKKYSDYLTKAFYSIPLKDNRKLIINIDNKGSKDNFAVGNIRIDSSNGADESIIKQSIEDYLSQKDFVHNTKEIQKMTNDFREEIYSSWIEKCKVSNIKLEIIQSHNNQDVFCAISEKESLIFRVWYGTSEHNKTKGFFSKIEVLEKSSENLLMIIKKYLSYEYSNAN